MPAQVDAIYENGVLRPLQPLNLQEHEKVVVSVVPSKNIQRSSLAVEYIESVKRDLQGAGLAPSLTEVQQRLSKIPGSMAAEIVSERGEH